MATVESSARGRSGKAFDRGAAPPAPAARSRTWPAQPSAAVLGAGLLIVIVYAVFAHGATSEPAQPRIEVAVALGGCLAAVALLWTGSLQLRLPRLAVVGIALLAAFAGWTGVSLVWSVASNLSWIEFNETVLYVLVVLLAAVFGSSAASAVQRTARGLLAVLVLVLVYALLQKLLPGVHLGALVNLNQTAVVARLQEPIGYWNALALLFAIGAPLALAFAVRRESRRGVRLGALLTLQLMIVAGAFTVSRGGIFAFVVALLACILLCGSRLRALMWTVAAVLAAAPVLVLGLGSHALSGDGVALARRETAGLLLLLLLLATGTLLWLGGLRLLELERTVRLGDQHRRRIGRALLGALIAVFVLGLLAVTASHRGLTGTISHVWDGFTSPRAVSVSSPSRLFTDASGNRWTWWKEALGAFSARPLTGWGAGSFPVVHLLFRHNKVSVDHAHSALFQWLAEDGLPGTLAVIGGWVLLLVVAIRAVRARTGSERLLAAALAGAVLAYSLHALIDWDWDIPGVTLPVLTLLGVLAGSTAGPRAAAPPAALTTAFPAPAPRVRTRLSPSFRLGAVALMSLGLCAYSLSSALPSVAAGRASAAEVAAAVGSSADLRVAADDASLATRLDPLSDAGPIAAADVASRRGTVGLAYALLVEAVRRQPSDATAWSSLAGVDTLMHHPLAALEAERRARELDPQQTSYATLLAELTNTHTLATTPPADSATAVATPVTPADSP